MIFILRKEQEFVKIVIKSQRIEGRVLLNNRLLKSTQQIFWGTIKKKADARWCHQGKRCLNILNDKLCFSVKPTSYT